MSSLLLHLRQSLKRPDHWLYASWLDIVLKYRRTRLGLLWMLVPTAVYIWGIGGFLAALQPGIAVAGFLAHVGIGFVVFRLISTVAMDATTAFAQSQAYIYDGHTRLTDFVLRAVARSFGYFLLSLPVALAAAFASPEFDAFGTGLAFLGLATVMWNLFVFSVLLAIAGARFPDLHEAMGSAVMALFLVTPVVWYASVAPPHTLHGQLMRANPLHHMIAVVRAPLLGEQVEPVTWVYLAAMTAAGTVAAVWVYRSAARRVPQWL
ncbi:ABC transporter permease [Lysobacter enzymogenes]|uniref:ABC-2 type transporter domain-containing protein n=1 Tax=Lysobacter enzymogenes TaxID=69 RepID=A0A3N2RJ10_LYSEN|nr:hypothetical protein [Lysobacter enzymogenes]ROU07437.1 hypothetical protein D9T17_09030 [Lysobacter enzymogenes]